MHPSIALLEFDSLAVGIVAADAMAKRASVEVLLAGSIHPGRYLVLVGGGVAEVAESAAAGRAAGEGCLRDEVVLPDVHGGVVAALGGARPHGEADALGIIETRTVAAAVAAADAGLKAAAVTLTELRLGDDLGGRGYLLFGGAVADVEAAVAAGVARIDPASLVACRVIGRLDRRVAENLAASPRFAGRIGGAGSGER